jgi:hypothetical protein
MKKTLIFIFLLVAIVSIKAQNTAPFMNIRLSFLLFPFSPLLTVEVRTIGNVTLQGETNFVHTHGVNVKYYTTSRMEKNYFFVGFCF